MKNKQFALLALFLSLSLVSCGEANSAAWLSCIETCKTDNNCTDDQTCAPISIDDYVTKLFSFQIIECNKKFYIKEHEADYTQAELIAANAACYDDYASTFTDNSDEKNYVLCAKQCEIDHPVEDEFEKPEPDPWADPQDAMRDLDANVCIWECMSACPWEGCIDKYFEALGEEDTWNAIGSNQDCITFGEKKCPEESGVESTLRELNEDYATCWKAVSAQIYPANSDELTFATCYATCAETHDIEFHLCDDYEDDKNLHSEWFPIEMCERACFNENQCNETCQESMFEAVDFEPQPCYNYLVETGGRYDDIVSNAAVESAAQCWEAQPAMKAVSEGSYNCIQDNCLFDPREQFANAAAQKNCKSSVCLYEVVECKQKCDLCQSDYICWTKEDDIAASKLDWKSCDDFGLAEKDITGWGEPISKSYMDRYTRCINEAEQLIKENELSEKAVGLVSCHRECLSMTDSSNKLSFVFVMSLAIIMFALV